MNTVKKIITMLILASLLLNGCAMRTVDQLYSPPKRSEKYNHLQSAMDAVMTDLDYCAPLSGENQQTVQIADLDGDGSPEYLVFAKGSGDKPLKILIFQENGERFQLKNTIESSGYAFEQVEYIHFDGKAGCELVVGRQVSDQVLRSVSIYSFGEDSLETLMTGGYSKFLTCDLDNDNMSEVFLLHPGQTESDNGVAELFSWGENGVERSTEVNLSEPVDHIKRIMVSRLDGGVPAVYVASAVAETAMITDVFALVDGKFSNVSLSNESGTSVKTLRNYYVYANDIDNDGVIELPSLINMYAPRDAAQDNQYLIRWYAMNIRGEEVDKRYTYHNFGGGWYLCLDEAWASRVSVEQYTIDAEGQQFEFYVWNEADQKAEHLLTLYALTGDNREEKAIEDNRFILYKTESAVYAANLEGASVSYGLDQQTLTDWFSMIRMDWKTGET